MGIYLKYEDIKKKRSVRIWFGEWLPVI